MTQRQRGFRNASAIVSTAVKSVREAAQAAGLEADIVRFDDVDYLYVFEEGMALLAVDIYENREGLQVVVICGNYWRDFRSAFLAGLVNRGLQYTYRLPNVSGERHMVYLLQSLPVTIAEAEADVAVIAAGRKIERDVMRLLKRGLTIDQVCEVLRLTRIYDVLEERIVEQFTSRVTKPTISDVRTFAARTYRRRDAVTPQANVSAFSQRTRALRSSGVRITYAR